MEKKQLMIEIRLTFEDVKRMNFRTVVSPFKFTTLNRIYYTEYLHIEFALKSHNIQPHEVVDFKYIIGRFKPFMMNDVMPVLNTSEYHIVIKAMVGMSPQRSIMETKTQIANLFLSSTTIEDKKKLYRRLMLQYHPDKQGGSEEITKYINSFKTWK